MGNSKKLQKIQTGTLSEEDKNWKTVETKIINGKKVSVICRKNPNDSSSLPYYTDTSDIYLLFDRKENTIKQMAIFDTNTHFRLKDFDWEHSHNNEFKEGEIHIHKYNYENNYLQKIREAPQLATEKEERFLKYILKEFNYEHSQID